MRAARHFLKTLCGPKLQSLLLTGPAGHRGRAWVAGAALGREGQTGATDSQLWPVVAE